MARSQLLRPLCFPSFWRGHGRLLVSLVILSAVSPLLVPPHPVNSQAIVSQQPASAVQLEFRLQKPGTETQLQKLRLRQQELKTAAADLKQSGTAAAIAANQRAIAQNEQALANLYGPVVLDRTDVARVELASQTTPEILIQFTLSSSQKFARMTQQIAGTGRSIGIFINHQLISAPTVGAELAKTGITGGRAAITGRFTQREAEDLVNQLQGRQAANSTALFRVLRNGKWGYINALGDLVVNPQFDDAKDFSEGLAAVRVNDRYGYLDPQGRMVISPQFQNAFDFSEDLAAVVVKGKLGFIDRTGQIVIVPQFSATVMTTGLISSQFSNGLAMVVRERQSNLVGIPAALQVDFEYEFIDRRGRVIIPASKQRAIHAFSEGLLAAQAQEMAGKWGYRNAKGEWAIAPQFAAVGSFSEGVAAAQLNRQGKYGYIDKTGRIVIQPQFEDAQPFSEGLAGVKIGNQWGYIDRTGKQVIPPSFDEVKPFSEGLAVAWKRPNDMNLGFIDRTGKWAIAPKFRGAVSFKNGLAAVDFFTAPGNFRYIDKTGQYVWNP